MTRTRAALCVAAAVCAPAVAQANTGIGFFFSAVPFLILALVPAILIEGFILARAFAVPYRRGALLSLYANVVSTLAGAAAAIALDVFMQKTVPFTRATTLASLVPVFFVGWWVEYTVVARAQAGIAHSVVARATLAANAVSYSLMAIGIALTVPDVDPLQVRWQVTEVLTEMRVESIAVAEHFQGAAGFPAPRDVAPTSRHARSIKREAGGRIVAETSFEGVPDVHLRHIVMEPRLAGGAIVEWRCYSPDMPLKYLPPGCRRSSPEDKP